MTLRPPAWQSLPRHLRIARLERVIRDLSDLLATSLDDRDERHSRRMLAESQTQLQAEQAIAQ